MINRYPLHPRSGFRKKTAEVIVHKVTMPARSNRFMCLTVVISVVLIAIVATVFCTTLPRDDSKDLRMLHVIFRHGQRTPADTYPTDPHLKSEFEPYGWGQLTNNGKMNLYNLGKFLRNKYDGYLGDLYTPDICHIQTTDVTRTKMSAQLLSAGLWPPNAATKWGPLDWQPIGIDSQPLNQDTLLLVRLPCPAWSIERERVENSSEVQAVYKKNKKLMDYLAKQTGRPVKDAEDMLDIQGTLSAEKEYGATLPAWAEKVYPQTIPLSAYSFTLNAKTNILKRLKGGVLLKKIIGDWEAKSKNEFKPKNRKVFLYGGHDSTISNLLSTIGVWDEQVVGYGVAIILELREKNDVLGVQVSFKNQTTVDPVELTIPGCDKFCPLDKVIELTKPVIPVDWDEECKTDDPNYVPPPPGGP